MSLPDAVALVARIQADYFQGRMTALTDDQAALLRAWLKVNPKPPSPQESRGGFHFYGALEALWVHYRYLLSRAGSADKADSAQTASEQAISSAEQFRRQNAEVITALEQMQSETAAQAKERKERAKRNILESAKCPAPVRSPVGAYVWEVMRQSDVLDMALRHDLKEPQQWTEEGGAGWRLPGVVTELLQIWAPSHKSLPDGTPQDRLFAEALRHVRREEQLATFVGPLRALYSAHEELLTAYHFAWQDHREVPFHVIDNFNRATIELIRLLPAVDSPAAADPRQQLADTESIVLAIIRAQPKGRGIAGKEIIKKLKAKKIQIKESTLRKHILPKLRKHYGVINHRAAGGYLIA
jgi:hypothetical protein